MNAVWSGNLPETFRQAEFDSLIEATPGCLDGETPLVRVHFESEWWDSVTHDPPMRTVCRVHGTPAAKEALFEAMGGVVITAENPDHPGMISLRDCNSGTDRFIAIGSYILMTEDCEAEGVFGEAGQLKRLKP